MKRIYICILLLVLTFPAFSIEIETNTITKINHPEKSFFLHFEGIFGLVSSKVADFESKAGEISVTYNDGTTEYDSPSHASLGFGMTAEILMTQRLGLRFGIHYKIVAQFLGAGDGEKYESVNWNANLMEYLNPFIGINWHLADPSKSNLSIFAQAGYISGTAYVAPALLKFAREEQASTTETPSCSLGGISATVGIAATILPNDSEPHAFTAYISATQNFFKLDRDAYFENFPAEPGLPGQNPTLFTVELGLAYTLCF